MTQQPIPHDIEQQETNEASEMQRQIRVSSWLLVAMNNEPTTNPPDIEQQETNEAIEQSSCKQRE